MARRQKGWWCNMMIFLVLVIWIFVRFCPAHVNATDHSLRSCSGGGDAELSFTTAICVLLDSRMPLFN